MSHANRERVKELLSQASRLPPAERAAFITKAAGADRQAAAEALDLLATLDDPVFMNAPTGAGIAAALPGAGVIGEGPGTTIDRYKLLQLIGEGGFGSVFMAEQTEPVHRKVALKVIKAGMDTKQVIARFEAERQALALMDHPNIAKVLDAGATFSGRPYFVMELVRGEPVTRYCDRERLPVHQRLELFRDVCHAVQHAHQKGIIHRDLKPSNILVTVADGFPLPKVIDFGIAKATETRLTDKTLFTEMHQLIGTPEYMSPEQAEVSGVDIDTRSDIYSLGVLLYELLAGSTPLERGRLHATPLAEIQRLIREEEPLRPSLRLATLASSPARGTRSSSNTARASTESSAMDIAQFRRTEPSMLTRTLRGDLDWIVMKCLEKDRRRRYETAVALADDVERHLSDLPVFATPPSATYKLGKFVRRNRGAVLAAAAISSTLVIFAVVSVAFAISAIKQRHAVETALKRVEKAETETKTRADELERVTRFQEAQLSSIKPQTMGIKLREDLLAKVRTVAERSGNSSEEVDARVRELEQLIAGVDLTGLALTSLDENVFRQALDAIETQFAAEPLIKARLLQSFAAAQYELGLVESAIRPQEEALAIRRRELGDDHFDTITSISNKGELLLAQGKFAEAEPLLQQTVQSMRHLRGDDDPETLRAMVNLGHLFNEQGKLVEAEAYFREAITKFRVALGDADPTTLAAMANLAPLLQQQNRLAEAEPLMREVLDTRRRVLGDDHPDTLVSIHHMGLLLAAQGRLDEAETYFRESLDKHRRVLGNEHPHTLGAIMTMGFVLRNQGRLAEVEPYYLESLEKRRLLLGDDHPDTITTVNNMGFLLLTQGKYAEAEPYCREAAERWHRLLGDEHPDTLLAVNNLGLVLFVQDKLAEAEPFCREALDGRRLVRGEEHSDTLISMTNMGQLLRAQEKHAEAVGLLSPAESPARTAFSGNPVRLGRLLTALGRARVGTSEFDHADANLHEAYSIIQDSKGATDRDHTDVLTGLMELYDARHAAVPKEGYDVQAAEWRKRLQTRKDTP